MKIRNFVINEKSPCFIIAEIANNHDKRKFQAVKLIRLAAKAGANAVKFQTFSGLDIACANQRSTDYHWPPALKYKYWHQFLDTIMLPFEWYPELIKLTHDLGMAFIATPCSVERAHFLKNVGADAIKVASMDNNNIPFLAQISKMTTPIIISSGMAERKELKEALSALGYPRRKDLALLHCVSNYPTKGKNIGLDQIKQLKSSYKIPIGFSDHALENYGAFAAVAMGAKIVEKHITVDRSLEGPDHFFSLEPAGLTDLVRGIREIEDGLKPNTARPDKSSRKTMYRSIHAAVDIRRGTILTKELIEIKRPAGGLEPKYFWKIIGRRIRRDINKFEPITQKELS